MLGEGEAPLRVPDGFDIVTCAPAAEALDSSNVASDEMIGKMIIVRFEYFGWCKGTITDKIVDKRRTINKDQVNFKAEFDIDKGDTTDLSLGLGEYDTSPSADYQSWLLLAPASHEATTPAALA